MAELPRYWLLVVIAFPALHTYYYGILGAFLDPEESNWTYPAYSVFVFGGGGIFYLLAPIEFSFGLDPLFFILLIPGAALYLLETYLWYQYTKKPIEAASEPLKQMLLVPMVPIPEEIVFRGGLTPLIGVIGGPAYVVLSGVLFGLYHYSFSLRDVLLKTVSGMIYAGLYLATGSLVAPILMHTGYNIASVYIIADYRHVPILRKIAPGT